MMSILLLSFLLFVSTTTRVMRIVQAEKVSGYLIDKMCVSTCIGIASDQPCTPDQVNVFFNPQGHTGWCLLMQSCIDSGYVLMSEFPDQDASGGAGKHTIILDLHNNASMPTVLSYIQAGMSGMFPLITVEYDETTAQEINGSKHTLGGVTIRDTWDDDSTITRYSGEKTHQVVCKDSYKQHVLSLRCHCDECHEWHVLG
jgi:hypothetical protein